PGRTRSLPSGRNCGGILPRWWTPLVPWRETPRAPSLARILLVVIAEPGECGEEVRTVTDATVAHLPREVLARAIQTPRVPDRPPVQDGDVPRVCHERCRALPVEAADEPQSAVEGHRELAH